MFTIIKDQKTLDRNISQVIKAGATWRGTVHTVFVSALVKAAEGGIQSLNNLFQGVDVNTGLAMQAYVGWVQRELLTQKDGKAGAFLSFSSKERKFSLIQNTQHLREQFTKLAESKLINPDGKRYGFYYTRNVIQDHRLIASISDAQIASAVKALYDRATATEITKNGRVIPVNNNVSSNVKKQIKSLMDLTQSVTEQKKEVGQDKEEAKANAAKPASNRNKKPPAAKRGTLGDKMAEAVAAKRKKGPDDPVEIIGGHDANNNKKVA